jgi:hypothetical protein
MAENVKSLLTARLDRIEKKMSETNRRFLDAYFYKVMEENEVDLRDDQAMRASYAVADMYSTSIEMLQNLQEKAALKFEAYFDAKEQHGIEGKITQEAKSELEAVLSEMEQHPDSEWVDRYCDKKIQEYGVDAEDEQADRTMRAMNKYMEKVIEMQENKQNLKIETIEREVTLRKKTQSHSRK